MAKGAGKKTGGKAAGAADGATEARGYVHADKTMVARPEVGAALRFRGRQAPTSYRYDSSLSPALDWDTNPVREQVEFLLVCIEDAARLEPPQLFPAERVMRGSSLAPAL